MGNRYINLKRAQKLLQFIFIFSVIVYIYSRFALSIKKWSGPDDLDHLARVLSLISLITSITSLLCLILTTVLNLRKEKRETRSFELDNQKKELEIERLRRELDNLRVETKTSQIYTGDDVETSNKIASKTKRKANETTKKIE